ncbi:MAG: hypothetical protein GY849_23990 [Deltaproteobacteria bacterium]|nr:hypothetical protein [Deltaproteobacteria bacterium]
MSSLIRTWGTEPHERLLVFPCDRFLESFDDAFYRGITIHAHEDVVFRWLCQMRVAPYSYDWIDNLGRQSPRQLTPGLEELEIGQRVMTMFELVDFVQKEHLTIRTKMNRPGSGIFGDVAVSYVLVSQRNGGCRLLVKVLVQYPGGLLGRVMRLLLPWGDLIMMRRQLLNFKKFSEQGLD